MLAGPVMSFAKPFLMRMKTDDKEPHGGVAINNRFGVYMCERLGLQDDTGWS